MNQASNNKVRTAHLAEDSGVHRLASFSTNALAPRNVAEQTFIRRIVPGSVSPSNFSFGVLGQADNLLPFSVE